MNCVDGVTKAKLSEAKDTEEIEKILDGSDVKWQTTMPCLRHGKYCQVRHDVDMESCPFIHLSRSVLHGDVTP